MHAKKNPPGKYLDNLHITFIVFYTAMHWEFKEQMSKNIKYVKMSLYTG